MFAVASLQSTGQRPWDAFFKDDTEPFSQALFMGVVRCLGPTAVISATLAFNSTEAQAHLVCNIEDVCKRFASRTTVHTCLREPMPKAMHWLGTAIMTNHNIGHALPYVLKHKAPPSFPKQVIDPCCLASVTFLFRRYVVGQAVLSMRIREQSWIGRVKHFNVEPFLARAQHVLRRSTRSCITQEDVAYAELGVKHKLHSKVPKVQTIVGT